MNIAELHRLEAEATPGDWDQSGLIVYDTCMDAVCTGNSSVDAALIVAMRNALPELLAKAEDHDSLVEALTPSAGTKAAYMGEFSFPFPIFNPDGEEMPFTPNVPWVTIKEIMKAIADRAALAKLGGRDE